MKKVLSIVIIVLLIFSGCAGTSSINKKDNISDNDERIIKEFRSHHGYSSSELKHLGIKYLGEVEGYRIYYVPIKTKYVSGVEWVKDGYTFPINSATRIIGIKLNRLYVLGEMLFETRMNTKEIYDILPEEFKDNYGLNVLYPELGKNQMKVLDELSIKDAQTKIIGNEIDYTTKINNRVTTLIFTNNLCSGYNITFNDARETLDGLDVNIGEFNKFYGNKLPLTDPDSKLNNITTDSDRIKSIKNGSRYFDEWNLPRNSENEKILLGEKANEFNGLNVQLSLQKQDGDYIVTVKYTANRNK